MKRTLAALPCLLGIGVTAGSAAVAGEALSPGANPFPIRGYHQHLYPDRQPMQVFHQRLEELKKYGYNMVVFGMGSPGKSTITMQADGSVAPNGCTTADLRGLVRRFPDASPWVLGLGGTVLGAATYGTAAYLLGMEELQMLTQLLLTRFRQRFPARKLL